MLTYADVCCIGKELASSSLDGQIYFWSAIDGKLLGRYVYVCIVYTYIYRYRYIDIDELEI